MHEYMHMHMYMYMVVGAFALTSYSAGKKLLPPSARPTSPTFCPANLTHLLPGPSANSFCASGPPIPKRLVRTMYFNKFH